ncbi:MAG: 3-deoxy-manno-octulosonate cytidylyltransferase [Candidatus Cloacimonetes bacterium]|jgi:3-deoxy-manno-octulosonate cytidylyltransferase (CMP-KDO synthetase)|nr:3-deoxy-manno-octulosonate cytidylyltransferase [Candidatus Cloacimonadota bacterium]MDD2505730.1 3-deoxy-manno-octulosonate cytidylyltransferase [Candidatus Cloacimonadota bacterium]MDD4559152.1 3-deoxy-manno-octulosonate cytidylyltransferase [Candidatus Cloacimonadota bacterium]
MISYAVIPARYASSRFPGKPLALLAGKPILQHVWERASRSKLFNDVIIATDDLKISSVAQDFGAVVMLTDSSLPSGTDRVAAVAEYLEEESVILNIQGDEPLISIEALTALLQSFKDEAVMMASLMTPFENDEDITNPNMVKVVTDSLQNAIYFSRCPIPYNRDKDPDCRYFRHIGVYGFRHPALMRFVSLPVGKLEAIEKLEQLRALENSIPIRMTITNYKGIGIDTPEDLKKVSAALAKGKSL